MDSVKTHFLIEVSTKAGNLKLQVHNRLLLLNTFDISHIQLLDTSPGITTPCKVSPLTIATFPLKHFNINLLLIMKLLILRDASN